MMATNYKTWYSDTCEIAPIDAPKMIEWISAFSRSCESGYEITWQAHDLGHALDSGWKMIYFTITFTAKCDLSAEKAKEYFREQNRKEWCFDTWYDTSKDCSRLCDMAWNVMNSADELPFVRDISLVDYGFTNQTTGKDIGDINGDTWHDH